jgi:hypothetical protein
MADDAEFTAGTIIQGAPFTSERTDAFKKNAMSPNLFIEQITNQAPLTKMLMSVPKQPHNRYYVKWGNKRKNLWNGDIVDICTDVACTQTIGDSAKTTGTTYYAKMLAVYGKDIVVDSKLALHNSYDESVVVVYVYTVPTVLADPTYWSVPIRLTETDTNKVMYITTGHACTFEFEGVLRVEGDVLPDDVYEEPTVLQNFMENRAEALSITGSEAEDADYWDMDTWALKTLDAHDRWTIGMERSLFSFMPPTETITGSSGLTFGGSAKTGKKRTMGGLGYFLKTYQSSNIINVKTLTTFEGYDYTGKTWPQIGYQFIQALAQKLSHHDENQRYVFVGALGEQAWTDAFLGLGNVTFGPQYTDRWGFKVRDFIGLGCPLTLKIHPLITNARSDGEQRSAWIVAPNCIKLRPKTNRDMKYIGSQKESNTNGLVWVDGKKEGWHGEYTAEYHNLASCARVYNLGCDVNA